jgi:hypothetical protein
MIQEKTLPATPVHAIVTQPRTVKPYFDAGGITIYNGDTFDLFDVVDSVDVVITDPPFGVRSEDWDAMSENEFARFSMQWISVARKVSDTLVTFSTQEGPIRDICRTMWPRVRQLIWHKPLGSQYAGASECRLWFAYEPIYHCHMQTTWEVVEPKNMEVAAMLRAAREKAGLSKGGVDMVIRGKKTGLCYRWEEAACIPTPEQIAKLKTILELGDDFDAAVARACDARESVLEKAAKKAAEKAAEKTDVFSYRTVTNGRHPCEKPLGLMCDLITTLTEENDLILDPFMGSGTTLEAAKLSGRRAIGFEMNERYCETAAKRLAQGVLF